MAALTIPHTFIAGTPALASEVNANFQAVVSWTQGQISTDNIGILGARSVALPSSPTFAILSISQTASQIALNISNNGTDSAVAISQSGSLAAGKAALLINSPSTQSNVGAAELLMTLASNSSIPAILVKHSATETFKLTKDYLSLEVLFKPAIRTTAQRNGIVAPEEGSVLYNTDSDQLNVRRSDAWVPVEAPVGSVQMYAVDSAPEGWLLCNGQAVSRTTYGKLFAVLNTTYGSGDGLTTFNVPNFVGVFPRGSQMGGITTQTIGGETFNAQIRSTTQRDATAVNGLSATQAAHNHSYLSNSTNGGEGDNGGGDYEFSKGEFSNTTGNATPAITVSSTDTETRPANLSIAFIIKY